MMRKMRCILKIGCKLWGFKVGSLAATSGPKQLPALAQVAPGSLR